MVGYVQSKINKTIKKGHSKHFIISVLNVLTKYYYVTYLKVKWQARIIINLAVVTSINDRLLIILYIALNNSSRSES